jgi:heme-degrading monooxygenase HmoA
MGRYVIGPSVDKKEAKMHVRISTIEGNAGKIDDAVATINEKVFPVLTEIEGFTAANFVADRSGGRLIGITFWDSESALDASVEAVNPIRTAVADAMGGKVVGVESFELVAQSW